MIKKVIFDLDNTLIMWKEEYWDTLNDTLDYFNISYDDIIINKLKESIDTYEDKYDHYNTSLMKSLMEEYASIKLPNNFIDEWKNKLINCYPSEIDEEIIDILKYLKEKYELVVLTNWFTDQQTKRLENSGILSYFDEVIGTEELLNKPNIETFLKVCEPYNPSECMMIGDSIKTDIEGSKQAGLKYLLFNYKNIETDIPNIKTMKELKEIL